MANLLIKTNMKYIMNELLSSCKGERPQASRMEARPTRRLLTRKETGVKVLNL